MSDKSHLVTSSLINSVKWAIKAPSSIIKEEKGGDGKLTWREKALTDLSNTLNRVRTPFSPEAKYGVEFENKVYKVANNEEIPGSDYFKKVCQEVKGFNFQRKQGIKVEIAGCNCYLYGKYDAVKDDTKYIKDIKTTGKYRFGKYLDTVQHKLYCYIAGEGYDVFDYIIAEWDEYPKIKAIHIERYRVNDREKLERELFLEVEDCFESIKDFGLWEAYREKYCLY